MDDYEKLARQGSIVLGEWWDTESLDDVHNELLSQLTAMVFLSTFNMFNENMFSEVIETIKVSLMAAYQIGRASARGE